MVVGPSGKRITKASRRCTKCGVSTQQVCYGIRYEKPDPASESYAKHMFLTCETCGELSEELREIPELTEQLMLINRLLKIGEDYDVKSVSIQSDTRGITVRAEFPDYDYGGGSTIWCANTQFTTYQRTIVVCMGNARASI